MASEVHAAAVAARLGCNSNARRIQNEPAVFNVRLMSKHIARVISGTRRKASHRSAAWPLALEQWYAGTSQLSEHAHT
eukprot:5625043-Pyramimonas_sp.AAC.1